MKALLLKGIRYWHTLRYLRPTQIVGRIQHLLRRPAIDDSPIGHLRPVPGEWVLPARCDQRMLSESLFCFLNATHDINSATDWNNNQWAKLWLYNLHYFDDLTATNAGQRVSWHRDLIDRWVDENPPGVGNGWEPYPSSLRIVNLIKWALAGNTVEMRWMHSLAIQVRFLSQNIETHLLGNHLFANAKALLFAGLFFEGNEAGRWYEAGCKLIERELPEQVLADGGNFELSTMYHIIFLGDLLDLINLHRAYDYQMPSGLEERVALMFNWLAVMCHPDDEISFFNDAALGVTPSVHEIQEYGIRLRFFGLLDHKKKKDGVTTLSSSGYTRVQLGNAVALIDRAAVGPDYLPGHAHADTLSFELSLFGHRVVVNSGTSVYGSGADRQQERGTAMHSTVVVDGQDSSEVWGGFRVARRARVFNSFESQLGEVIRLSACHDGYKRLPGKLVHCREWLFEEDRLIINDMITGKGNHEVMSVLPLHPDVEIRAVVDNQVVLAVAGNEVVVTVEGDGDLDIAKSSYHPEFGLSVDNMQLVFRSSGTCPIAIKTKVYW